MLSSVQNIKMNVINKPIKFGIPVVIATFVVIVSILQIGVFGIKTQQSTVAYSCTITSVTGNVEIFNAESNTREEANDGAKLVDGTKVKTSPDSQALLTFFDGSTLELGADTEIEIESVQYRNEGPNAIVIKQWVGKTWSRVVELVNPNSSYEIITPSASAVVRGTSFLTAVDNDGGTIFQVVDGTVVVSAGGNEVTVTTGREIDVRPGSYPSQPTTTGSLMPGFNSDPSGKGPDSDGPPGRAEDKPPSKGTGQLVSQGDEDGSDNSDDEDSVIWTDFIEFFKCILFQN